MTQQSHDPEDHGTDEETDLGPNADEVLDAILGSAPGEPSTDLATAASEPSAPSIFEAFDPPPDVDPNRFGPVPVVGDGAPAAGDVVDLTLGDTEDVDLTETESDLDIDALDAEAHSNVIRIGGSSSVMSGDGIPDDPKPLVTGPTDLPHWTEPATGQVPPVVATERPDGDVWQDLSGPRWKGEGPDWAEDDFVEALAADSVGDGRDDTADPLDDEFAEVFAPVAGSKARPDAGPLRAEDGDTGERNIPQAIVAGIVMAAIALAAFRLSGNLWALGLVTIIAGLAAVEVFDAMRRAGLHPAILLGITASVSFPLSVYARGDAAFPLMLGLLVIFGALWYIVGADTHRPALNLGLTFLGVSWVGGLAAFAALLLLLPDGKSMVVAAIIITVASDTFALAGGKAFGSRPFHRASPNKTWEGTIVGFVAAVAAGVAVATFDISPFSLNLLHGLYLGAVIGVLAPLGDLTESLIKRDLGVKDMGKLLPGHGGVLDRVDGLLFALPGTYYLALLLGLV